MLTIFKKKLNKEDKNIKFKLETKKNNVLNFMDVKIMRKGGEVLITVFRNHQ